MKSYELMNNHDYLISQSYSHVIAMFYTPETATVSPPRWCTYAKNHALPRRQLRPSEPAQRRMICRAPSAASRRGWDAVNSWLFHVELADIKAIFIWPKRMAIHWLFMSFFFLVKNAPWYYGNSWVG